MSDTETRHTPFPATAWTVIEAAKGEGEDARKALERLCQAYWSPVFGFIKRKVRNHDNAEDLTQEFFHRLVKTRTVVEKADRNRGKFRSYLSQRLQWFLREQYKRESSKLKRLKTEALNENTQHPLDIPEPIDDPEFNRDWARRTGHHAMDRLEDRYRAEGKEERRQIFVKFRSHMKPSDIAATLNFDADTVKNELRAIRKEGLASLWNVVRATVADDTLASEEMEELQRLIAPKENPSTLDKFRPAKPSPKSTE